MIRYLKKTNGYKYPDNITSYRMRKRINSVFCSLFALIIGLLFSFPFIMMISGSFSASTVMSDDVFFWWPKHWIIDNYTTILNRSYFITWIANSFLYAVVPVLSTVIISLILGYFFEKRRFWGRNFLFWCFLSMIMVPTQVLAVPRFMLFSKMNLIDTYKVILLPAIWDITSVFFMRQYMKGIPNSIEEAAIIDGCGVFRVIFSIYAPMCVPAIASVAILKFVSQWNEFFYPLVFLTSENKYPITVGLSSIMAESSSFGLTMAGAVVNFLPTFIVFLCLQKYFIEGITAGGIKG